MGTYTVSELNNCVKKILSNSPHINQIWVKGDVSNLTKHASGHYYFTLKDDVSQVSCVSFRHINQNIRFELENSMEILVFGSIDLYTIRGQYQLIVRDMRPLGVGALLKAFEQLKKKLSDEGLFDRCYKKQIPKFPKKIGIVTSPTGAAIQDILKVIKRRNPTDIVIAPTIVQGKESAKSIAESIELLNKENLGIDVIIVGRGGGSLEDLWSFNEELVARAIFNSKIPIISAVGHETDYMIADFTADIRASTPSVAAEYVVLEKEELIKDLQSIAIRMDIAIQHNISKRKDDLNYLSIQIKPNQLNEYIRQKYQQIDEISYRMESAMNNIIHLKKSTLELFAGRLSVINPLDVFLRGYSLTLKNGVVVKSILDVKVGDDIEVVVRDGEFKCNINAKKPNIVFKKMHKTDVNE